MTENTQPTLKDLLFKSLFILGILIIIFLLAFAVIRIVPKLFSSFASVGNLISSPFTSSKIDIEANDLDLYSKESVLLEWNYEPKNAGVYSLKYECVDNLTVQITTNEGKKTVLCNTPYNLGDSKKAELTTTLTKENIFVDVPITITFGDRTNTAIEASGEITINVQDGDPDRNTIQTPNTNDLSSATVTAEPIRQTTPTQNTTTPAPQYGYADLAISAISATRDTIQFTIQNVGSKSTGIWYFTYSAPGQGSEISDPQVSLAPYQGIRYTLRFDSEFSNGQAIITADSKNSVLELNKSNNVGRINVYGNGNNNSNGDYDEDDDANLEIIDLEVGYLNGRNFYEDDRIEDNDEAGVRFVVKNTGGESTGTWRFKIENLPYDNENEDYESGRQASLRPGESRTITVGFDNIDSGEYDIRVEVDSDDDVDEEDERDNDESETLEVR